MSAWQPPQAAESCARSPMASSKSSATRMRSTIIPAVGRGIAIIAAGGLVLAVFSQTSLFDAVALDFVQQPSKTGSKFLLESVGGGVAMLDFDQDGLLDLYFVNGAALRDDMKNG